jgi:hypothetical protein
MSDDVKIHGTASPEKQKKIQKLCNSMKRIISEQPSDVVFETIAILTAIYIKEYIVTAEEVGSSITEGEVYIHLIELIKRHLDKAVFIPENKH